MLHRVAVLIMSNVLGVNQSSKSGDVAQIVLKSKLSALIGCEQKSSKSRANVVRLIPIYTVRKIVRAKARL